MHMFGWNGEVTLDGGNPWEPKDAPLIERSWIDPTYMRAMRIEIIAGRGFDDRDRIGAPPVTILSKRTADKFWPGQNPIGRRLWRDSGSKSGTPHEVIGVARDVRTYGLERVSPYIMYMAAEQEPFGAMTIVARSKSADPTAFVSTARQIVTSIDPSLPVSRVQTLNEVVAQSVRQPRLDLVADDALRRAGGNPRGCRRLRRDGVQRPPRAPRVRHPPRARRRSRAPSIASSSSAA